MAAAQLPEDGELRLGPVLLPAGRRRALNHTADPRIRPLASRPADPTAWVTSEPVPEPGTVWRELSRACAGTGLVPFLAAATIPGEPDRPWDSGDFDDPVDVSPIDGLDAADILRQHWVRHVPVAGDYATRGWYEEEREAFEALVAPFSDAFPGLAPACEQPLPAARLDEALTWRREPARIGLVPAARPGDVLPAIGWRAGNWTGFVLPVAAILRSWEERFGARLFEVGLGEFTLLAERPPASLAHAERLAAEMCMFADEVFMGSRAGLDGVELITPPLVGAPLWRFWWD
jgi:hypothetical protein